MKFLVILLVVLANIIYLPSASGKPNLNVEYTSNPTTKDIDFLTQKLNEETSAFGNVRNFAFFIRDENDAVIAGCNAFVIYNVIHVDQLWVHPEYRRQGVGSKIMESVHEYARNNGFKMITVNTMSFLEAVKFYESLGYEKDYQRPGYAKNSSFILFKKNL